MQKLEPELQAFIEEFPPIPIGLENLDEFRDWPVEPVAPPPAPAVTQRFIEGPSDNPELRVLIVDPGPGASNRPALLHMHGGGYVMGSPEIIAPELQEYARKTGVMIVSVDYRLAPETPYPGALEDNYAALIWLHRNANRLGVDPRRIAVGGESAGGGHAAVLAIASRDRKGPPIAFQFLVYPMLDDRSGTSREVAAPAGQHIWTSAHNRFGWSAYLGKPAGSKSVPEGAVPSRDHDLSNLPPAFIAVGDLDLFVEENVDYARRLKAAGVRVELFVQPGVFHGANKLVPNAPSSVKFNQNLERVMKKGW